MEKLLVCRICIMQNVHLHYLVDTNLRDMYERLTDMSFETKERSSQVCAPCYSKLQNCYQLRTMCLHSEELFTQMIASNKHKEMASQNVNSIRTGQMSDSNSGLPSSIETDDVENVQMIYVKVEECTDVEAQTLNQEDYHDNTEDDDTLVYNIDKVKVEVDVDYELNTFHDVEPECRQAIELEIEHSPTADDEVNANIDSKPNMREMVTLQTTKLKDNASVPVARIVKRAEVDKKTSSKNSNINEPMKNIVKNKYAPKRYKCESCDKSFNKKDNLSNHMSIHTGQKPYKCDMCEKAFYQRKNLRSHIRVHGRVKSFKCDICGKSFMEAEYLLRHTQSHTGENKPYKCDVCEKVYSYKSNLVRHTRVHTVEKRFKCDECKMLFFNKKKLLYHSRVHAGDKPFKCDVCGKCFRFQRYLTDHSRIHTGKKPFKCDLCVSSFTRTWDLTQHMRIHSGEKPYKCNICSKRFIRKSHLIIHMPIHSEEKPYRCDTCHKCFKQKYNLLNHSRRACCKPVGDMSNIKPLETIEVKIDL